MQKVADFVRLAKERNGDAHMSDRQFGEVLSGLVGLNKPIPTSVISNARYGKASDLLAIFIAEAAGVEPGAVLMASRLEREPNAVVRRHLERWSSLVGKALASVPSKAAGMLAAAALGLGLQLLPQPVQASTGGVERSRRRHRY